MKKILYIFFLLTATLQSVAQPGTFKRVTATDSVVIVNPNTSTILQSWNSPPLVFKSEVYDTINGISRIAWWSIYSQTTRGNATPRYSLLFNNKDGNYAIRLNSDLSVNMGNGISFSGTRVISAPSTITFAGSTNTGIQFRFANFTSALTNTGVIAQYESGGSTAQYKASTVRIWGDASQRVADFKTNGTVVLGDDTVPDIAAIFEMASRGRGMLPPRLTRDQRNGINKRVATVSLVDSGSGIDPLRPPAVRLPNSPLTGINGRVRLSTANGKISALILDFGGTGYDSDGDLIFDTTGTGMTSLPSGTYTVTTDTLPNGLTIYNTTTDCYEFYQHSTDTWRSWCDDAGGVTQEQLNDTAASIRASIPQDSTYYFDYPIVQYTDDSGRVHFTIDSVWIDSVRTRMYYTEVDLSTGDFFATKGGYFFVTHGSTSNKFHLPDPATMLGAKITILNIDATDNFPIDFSSPRPFSYGTSDNINSLDYTRQLEIIATSDGWRGGLLIP